VQLYILRHAHAEDGFDKADEARALTDEGHLYARALARYLTQISVSVDFLFTSPRLRALQTAQDIAEAVGQTPVIREELNFGFHVRSLDALLSGCKPSNNVMLVGHEPTLSLTLANLTGARLEMKKCGLARVEITQREPWSGMLMWLLAPKLLSPFIEE
jgi:phosphohistidine phosphatase